MADDKGLGVCVQNKFDPLAGMDGEKDLTGGVPNLLRYFLNRLRTGGRPANIHLPNPNPHPVLPLLLRSTFLRQQVTPKGLLPVLPS